MNVRIVRLRDGEDVICVLYEATMKNDPKTVIGYQLENPFCIWMKDGVEPAVPEDEELEPGEGMIMQITDPEIGFNPYAPLCKDDRILIKLDEVVTIYQTYPEIIEKYTELIEAKNGRGDGLGEPTYVPADPTNPDDEEYQGPSATGETGVSDRESDGDG